jgi:MFS family permease
LAADPAARLRDAGTTDVRLLFAARSARLFGYGLLSVVLVLYLAAAGLGEKQIGLLLTATLLGDTAVSLVLTTSADRLGRKRMLLVGAVLLCVTGAVLATTTVFAVLLLVCTLGVLSPSGNEVGPFLAVEQAALSQAVSDERRTKVFAWYALTASFATAAGALAGGTGAGLLQKTGWSGVESYRAIVWAYAAVGLLLVALFARLSAAIEVPSLEPAGSDASERRAPFGVQRSRAVVLKLAALFGLDAFGGGFIVQSLLAYWLHRRFELPAATLGVVFFWANVLAGFSALAAARIAARIGLIRTMVFTHLPSNLLLLAVPLMPNAASAVALLLARYSISQMDVPTRQSYSMAVVVPEERSAAAGITGVARTIGASLSPMLATLCMRSAATMSLPLYLAGGIKILYDLLLYRAFVALPPPEEQRDPHERAT